MPEAEYSYSDYSYSDDDNPPGKSRKSKAPAKAPLSPAKGAPPAKTPDAPKNAQSGPAKDAPAQNAYYYSDSYSNDEKQPAKAAKPDTEGTPPAKGTPPQKGAAKAPGEEFSSDGYYSDYYSYSDGDGEPRKTKRKTVAKAAPKVTHTVKLVKPAKGLGIGLDNKLVIKGVQPGSEAAKSGQVEPGDVLLSVNGTPVGPDKPPLPIFEKIEAGGHLELGLFRPPLQVTHTVTLVRSVDGTGLGIDEKTKSVKHVKPGSEAAKSGKVDPGDVLVTVNGSRVGLDAPLAQLLAKLEVGKRFELGLFRRPGVSSKGAPAPRPASEYYDDEYYEYSEYRDSAAPTKRVSVVPPVREPTTAPQPKGHEVTHEVVMTKSNRGLGLGLDELSYTITSMLPGSEAARSGKFQVGDVLVAFNGTRLGPKSPLLELFCRVEVGTQFELGLYRGPPNNGGDLDEFTCEYYYSDEVSEDGSVGGASVGAEGAKGRRKTRWTMKGDMDTRGSPRAPPQHDADIFVRAEVLNGQQRRSNARTRDQPLFGGSGSTGFDYELAYAAGLLLGCLTCQGCKMH